MFPVLNKRQILKHLYYYSILCFAHLIHRHIIAENEYMDRPNRSHVTLSEVTFSFCESNYMTFSVILR